MTTEHVFQLGISISRGRRDTERADKRRYVKSPDGVKGYGDGQASVFRRPALTAGTERRRMATFSGRRGKAGRTCGSECACTENRGVLDVYDGKGTKMNNAIGSETNKKTAKPGRDKTQYRFNGEIYRKNRLVLAVVQKYAKESPNISAGALMSAFDKSLQGSLGVVRPLEGLKDKYADFERRFFTKPHEIIRTSTGDCVVCTQWGKSPKPNIDAFLRRARLKYEISEVTER